MNHASNRTKQAETLGISRSNLYYKSRQDPKDQRLKIMIEEALRKHPAYGHKRMAIHLSANKKRVLRVMQKYDIKPYRRRGKKWLSKGTRAIEYPNLILNMVPLYPNHIWASDFTYLWFDGAWIYLATIIDVYTRKIVGMALSRSHDRWLVSSAMLDALGHYRRPDIAHSDHGSEYCSRDYQKIMADTGIMPSMASKGCPWENGYQESFYSQFKIELGDPSRFSSLGELTAMIYSQIYYYNNSRIHTALNMAPVAFARQYDLLLESREKVS